MVKIHTGKKGGKYYYKNGKKHYVTRYKQDYQSLPPEVKMETMYRLSFKNVLKMCQTNKSFNDICKQKQFWEKWALKQNFDQVQLALKYDKISLNFFMAKWFPVHENEFIRSFKTILLKPYILTGILDDKDFLKKWFKVHQKRIFKLDMRQMINLADKNDELFEFLSQDKYLTFWKKWLLNQSKSKKWNYYFSPLMMTLFNNRFRQKIEKFIIENQLQPERRRIPIS